MAEETTQDESFGLLNLGPKKAYGTKGYASVSRSREAISTNKLSLQHLANLFNEYTTKQNLLILASILMLMAATATERVTFKIMVDRMLPYKFVLVQTIYLFSSFIFSIMTAAKKYFTAEITPEMGHFPHSNIVLMAIIDTVPFICMAWSASGVPPTMTVILMHASTIFVIIGSKFTFPQRHYSNMNITGVVLIAVSITICLIKTVLTQVSSKNVSHHHMIIVSSFVFVAAASLQGLTTLYKEKCIIQWAQPIDNFYLSSWLFFYQFIVIIMMSMIFYLVAGTVIFDNIFYVIISNLYSSIALFDKASFHNMYESFHDGWLCFFGRESHDYQDDDSIYADCSDSMGVILAYVLSNAFVVVSMSSVLQVSHQALGRSTEFAVLTAFIVLWIYDLHKTQSTVFGGNEGIVDIFAILLLLVGMEVYDRDPEPDVELITNQATATATTSSGSSSYTRNNNDDEDDEYDTEG